MALPLPPLRKKILFGFLVNVGLYGCIGMLISVALFFAGGVTPPFIRQNNDILTHLLKIHEAVSMLPVPALRLSKRAFIQTQVASQLALLEKMTNVSSSVAQSIATLHEVWVQYDARNESHDRNGEKLVLVFRAIQAAIHANQERMVQTSNQSISFRYKVLAASFVLFLLTSMGAVLLADTLAFRLANPLKEIAEALRNKPMPGEKLKLPVPTSLELRVLTHEMAQLWRRLSELRALNLETMSEQRTSLEAVLEVVEDGILVLDNRSVVVQCNRGFARMIGMDRAHIMGQPWGDLSTTSDNYLNLRKLLNPKIKNESTIDLGVGKNRTRTFAIRSKTITNASQEATGALYLLHDITQSRQRDRLKFELMSALFYQLKSPLASISHTVASLQNSVKALRSPSNPHWSSLDKDIGELQTILEDFIKIGMSDESQAARPAEPQPITALLEDWILPFQIIAQDKNVELEYVPPSESIYARVDLIKFPWALSNVLSRMIQTSPPGSKVHIDASVHSPSMLVLELKNELPPSMASDEAVVAKRQEELSASSSGRLEFWLALTKEVVEAHGGRVEYASDQGPGAHFSIYLPSVSGPLEKTNG